MKFATNREEAMRRAEASVRRMDHPSYCGGVSVRTDDLNTSHVVEGKCVSATCKNCPRTAHQKYR